MINTCVEFWGSATFVDIISATKWSVRLVLMGLSGGAEERPAVSRCQRTVHCELTILLMWILWHKEIGKIHPDLESLGCGGGLRVVFLFYSGIHLIAVSYLVYPDQRGVVIVHRCTELAESLGCETITECEVQLAT